MALSEAGKLELPKTFSAWLNAVANTIAFSIFAFSFAFFIWRASNAVKILYLDPQPDRVHYRTTQATALGRPHQITAEQLDGQRDFSPSPN